MLLSRGLCRVVRPHVRQPDAWLVDVRGSAQRGKGRNHQEQRRDTRYRDDLEKDGSEHGQCLRS